MDVSFVDTFSRLYILLSYDVTPQIVHVMCHTLSHKKVIIRVSKPLKLQLLSNLF